MTRAQFKKDVISLLRKAEMRPKETATAFLVLNKRAMKLARASLSESDARECLGFAAGALYRSGHFAEAVNIEQELLNKYRAEMRYVGHAIANSAASAALSCFKLGQIDDGQKLAYEALEYFGRFPEPSPLIEQLGIELKKHR